MSDERRRIIGGWLGGPRSVSPLVLGFPGERLGFPEKGPGSVAPMGLRLAALIVDWVSCLLIGAFVTRVWGGLTPLVIFYAEILVLTVLQGASAGQRLFRIEVRPVDGGRLSPIAVVIRSLLLFMAIPAVIYDRDGRGLHDRAARTIVLRKIKAL